MLDIIGFSSIAICFSYIIWRLHQASRLIENLRWRREFEALTKREFKALTKKENHAPRETDNS